MIDPAPFVRGVDKCCCHPLCTFRSFALRNNTN